MWADSSEMAPLVTRTVLAVPCPEPAPFELLTYATVSCYRDVCAAPAHLKSRKLQSFSSLEVSHTVLTLFLMTPFISLEHARFPLAKGEKNYMMYARACTCAHMHLRYSAPVEIRAQFAEVLSLPEPGESED